MRSDPVLFLSPLGLGSGETLHGFGLAPPSSPLAAFESEPVSQLDAPSDHLSITARTWSSGTISSSADFGPSGGRLRVPSIRSTNPLAEVTKNVIDTRVLKEWDDIGEFIEVIRYIEDPDAFKSLFLDQVGPLKPVIRRTSLPESSASSLSAFDTAEETSLKDVLETLKSFQVPKKPGPNMITFDRFVTDATPLNKAQRHPPQPGIPRLHTLLQKLSSKRWFFSVDAVSFFYQFLLDPEVRKYFGIIFNRPRGRSFVRRLRRLCMGWKFSPAIGQRAANTMLREINRRFIAAEIVGAESFAWIDNFLFGFDSESDARKALPIVMSTFADCNCEVHPPSPIAQSLNAVGFVIAHGSTHHDPKFVEKIRHTLQIISPHSSLRELATFIGQVVWTVFARSIPLAFTPSIGNTLRSIQLLRKRGIPWDAPFDLPIAQLLKEVSPLIDTVSVQFSPVLSSGDRWMELFSDAMADQASLQWAFTSGDLTRQGTFTGQHHIFLLELITAAEALFWASKHTDQVLLFTDNTAVLFAIRAGHCGNAKGDAIIKHLFEVLPFSFRFKVAHVCSAFNPADQYTRGLKGHEGHPTYITWRG